MAQEPEDARTPSTTAGPDMFSDCMEFSKLMYKRTGKKASGRIDRKFITKMVNDELEELAEATDVAEEVDALLDAVYYILQHLSGTGIDVRPIWKLIHDANMRKFGPTGYQREDGKWMKPKDFVAPDDEIRQEIVRQLKAQKESQLHEDIRRSSGAAEADSDSAPKQ